MNILGLYDGHNANVTVLKGKKIKASVEEERFSRIKFHDGRENGLPQKSFDEVFKIAKMNPSDIDIVAVAIESPLAVQIRTMKHLLLEKNPRWLFFWIKNFGNYGPLYYGLPMDYQKKRKKKILNFLKKNGLATKEILWLNHQLCHNASAYFTSGFDEALAISFDGRGDGLCGQVYDCHGADMKLVHETTYQHSLGLLYSTITQYLGFRPVQHEGKITGLAAFGKPNKKLIELFKKFFVLKDKKMRFIVASKYPTKPYPRLSTDDLLTIIRKKLDKMRQPMENIAYALQKVTEEIAVAFVKKMIKETGHKNIALSGGLFANVKVNQRIAELKEVEQIFIHPGMTDAGLSMGASLFALSLFENIKPFKLNNIYFGPDYSDKQIEEALEKNVNKIKFSKKKNVEKETASLIAEKKIVARFNGRMEYGPRALGNRSILYDPQEKKVNDWLNKRLKRTEFMPFAPTALNKRAEELYKNIDNSRYTAKFMTISYNVTKYTAENFAAVTHIDNTARPQLLNKKDNESYYKILKSFEKETGMPCFVNTSFNIHGEPIVCTPRGAIRSFLESRLDVLSIGNYIAYIK